jgi:hypothetical protein
MDAGSDHYTFVLLKFLRTFPKASKNIQELGTTLVQEWQQYPKRILRRLVHEMRILDQELYRMRGGETRLFLLHEW